MGISLSAKSLLLVKLFSCGDSTSDIMSQPLMTFSRYLNQEFKNFLKDVERECHEYETYLNEFVENQVKSRRKAFSLNAADSIQPVLNRLPGCRLQTEKQRFHLLQDIADCLANTEIRLQQEEAADVSRHNFLASNTNGTAGDSDRFQSQAAMANELAPSNEGKTGKKNRKRKVHLYWPKTWIGVPFLEMRKRPEFTVWYILHANLQLKHRKKEETNVKVFQIHLLLIRFVDSHVGLLFEVNGRIDYWQKACVCTEGQKKGAKKKRKGWQCVTVFERKFHYHWLETVSPADTDAVSAGIRSPKRIP